MNTSEICKKAYARMCLLSRLKYVRMDNDGLVRIYITYIRCLLEYCPVVWHSSLTLERSILLQRVQKVALRIILGEEYLSYEHALESCKLETLEKRRQDKCI